MSQNAQYYDDALIIDSSYLEYMIAMNKSASIFQPLRQNMRGLEMEEVRFSKRIPGPFHSY